MHRSDATSALTEALDAYVARTDQEVADVVRVRARAASGDVWTRAAPLHVTGSAIVLHPVAGRVLLRWHARLQGWLQVGGHADPTETDPFQVALREAEEETGLRDLAAWPDPRQPAAVQIVIVPVPAGRGEPPHEHADIRFVLATEHPDTAVAETAVAQLRWLSIDAALALVAEDNLRVCLRRVAELLATTTT